MQTRLAAVLACGAILAAGCSQRSNAPSLPSLAPPQTVEARDAARYRSLYSFKGEPDGDTPNPDLIEANGALYGTTSAGGTANFGTLFKVTTGGSEAPIYSFVGGLTAPNGGVIEANGTFFGTTSTDAFAIDKTGAERTLLAISGGAAGFDAQGPLVLTGGKLYGATQLGGLNACNSGCGTLFAVTPSGSGGVLYKFRGNRDGDAPTGSLIAIEGELYGTTSYGGTHNGGTIFKIGASGKKVVLYNFTEGDDGSRPSGNLLYAGGKLYGAARYNGAKDDGTVFSLTLDGKFTLLHGFSAGAEDGESPNGGLVMSGGTLYGTTAAGGPGDRGTVFSVSKAGKEQLVYAFKGGNDGNTPLAGLVVYKNALYGSTIKGGTSKRGTIFAISL